MPVQLRDGPLDGARLTTVLARVITPCRFEIAAVVKIVVSIPSL